MCVCVCVCVCAGITLTEKENFLEHLRNGHGVRCDMLKLVVMALKKVVSSICEVKHAHCV